MTAPGALDSISELTLEHGPHAVVQAWLLASWLAARLGWRVEAGCVQPGVEIAWSAAAKHGRVRVTLRRHNDGPSEVHRMRIGCTLAGRPSALAFQVED